MKRPAFTLIELLVSITISGILLTVAASAYWVFLQSYQKMKHFRILQQEARFATTRIADKIRNNPLDFAAYENNGDCGPHRIQNHRICLKDYRITYKPSEENLFLKDQPLFSSKVKVKKFYALTFPKKDPKKYLQDPDYQQQPKVTLFLELSSEKYPSLTLPIQTTISSRIY